ncbi:ABC-type transport system substrate-binding protein [Bacillus mesophilus]|nr:ABC-type transport system substrate-binding protein [Bacillus mesophilus]
MIYAVDPTPLNWLYVLFNTMEETVRADRVGRIVPSLATNWKWVDSITLELKLREGVIFHNGQPFSVNDVQENFSQIGPWIAPHPPGTWLNLPKGRQLQIIDEYTVRILFPKTDGLALGKLRGYHFANKLFWQKLGFGYKTLGTAEGHW